MHKLLSKLVWVSFVYSFQYSNAGSNSRPASQRSRDTLRKVSSMLFISTPATAKKIDKSRLSELDSSTLVDLIKVVISMKTFPSKVDFENYISN